MSDEVQVSTRHCNNW